MTLLEAYCFKIYKKSEVVHQRRTTDRPKYLLSMKFAHANWTTGKTATTAFTFGV